MNLNFSGVWKGNLEKSKLLGPAPKAVLVKVNHADPELIVEMVITKMDDTEDSVLFRGLTNGEEVANPVHGIQVRSRSNWVGTELLTESWSTVMMTWQAKSLSWKERTHTSSPHVFGFRCVHSA